MALPLIGSAMAASVPMIATTIRISISEKPRSRALNTMDATQQGKRYAVGGFVGENRGWGGPTQRGCVIPAHRITIASSVVRGGGRGEKTNPPDAGASGGSGTRVETERLGLQVLVHQLGHLEHVDGGLAAEDGLQRVVSLDHPLV